MINYSTNELIEGIKKSDRVILSRAITLAESTKAEHRIIINEVIETLLPHIPASFRIGITGVPGVGKSTFIESFGDYLTKQGHKVAVLTVDPSSKQSGGSILGDKTRMADLAKNKNAYIRPSPAGSSLGGVARKTREAMILCEAAGFDIIIIETVGVGQSETAVSEMVDAFLLLMLSGAGDELQGIKKGIMESADIIAINKCDGDNILKSKEAQMEYRRAVQMFPRKIQNWVTQVMTVSSVEKTGIKEIWQTLLDLKTELKKEGLFNENRKSQMVNWFENEITYILQSEFIRTPGIKNELNTLKVQVRNGQLFAFRAAEMIVNKFLKARA